MPNYFRGTIGTLQNIIAQERQERTRKRTPEYQMAIEKLMVAKRDQTFRKTMVGLLKSGREFTPEQTQGIMAGVMGGEKGFMESQIKRRQLTEKRDYEEKLLGKKVEREKEFLREKPITPYEKEVLGIREKEAEARRLRGIKPTTAEAGLVLRREQFVAAQEEKRLTRYQKSHIRLLKGWTTLKGKPTKVKQYELEKGGFGLPSEGAVKMADGKPVSIEALKMVGGGTTAQKLQAAMKIVKHAQEKYPDQPISPEDLPDDILEFLNNLAKDVGLSVPFLKQKVSLPSKYRTKAKQILGELANSGQLR